MKIMKQRCIIYGGGGFIGSHLCDELLKAGYDVTVFDKLNFSKINIQHILNDIRVIEGDFNNEADIIHSLKDADYVFHLVSSTLPASSNENPEYDAESNLISSLRLFKECVNNKIKKVIFLSSGGTVYGIPDKIPVDEKYFSNPICSYGIIKKTIEEYLFLYRHLHGLNYNIFRLSNPYGERQNPFASQGAVGVFINKAIKGEEIQIWGDGNVIRDYIYIKDAVYALALAIKNKSDSRVFNLSTGEGHSLNDILKIIKENTHSGIKVKYLPARNIDVPVNVLDNSLLRKEFSWQPETPIKKGIQMTYNYYKNL